MRASLLLSVVGVVGLGWLCAQCAAGPTTPLQAPTPPSSSAPSPPSNSAVAKPLSSSEALLAAKRPVVNQYQGVNVPDDYQWLEQGNDPEVQSWSVAQNAQTRRFLEAVPRRNEIHKRVATLMSSQTPDYFRLATRRSLVFALKEQPTKTQPLLVLLPSLEDPSKERVLLDPNALDPTGDTVLESYEPSLDGSLVAVVLSKAGSVAGRVQVVEVATGNRRNDSLTEVASTASLVWNEDGSGFYYTRAPQQGEGTEEERRHHQQVWFHILGTAESKDRYEVGKQFPRSAQVRLLASEKGKKVLACVAKSPEALDYWLLGESGWSQLPFSGESVLQTRFVGEDSLYLLTQQGAPRGRILRVSLRAPSLATATVVVPQGDAVLQSFVVAKTKVYVVGLLGGPSQLQEVPLAGKAEPSTIPVLPVSRVAGLTVLAGDDLLFRNQSYLDPSSWYRYRPGTEKPVRMALRQTANVEFNDTGILRETCVSKDGTRVPLTILRPLGAKLEGSNPTLLAGYGAFGESETPRFMPEMHAWIEQGGVFAIAHVRGGGELGEPWHQAGQLTHKQNSFEDFQACAKALVDFHYTRPEKLALLGGSHGSLLLGALLTQHPEAFRAAVSFSGIFDMLRVAPSTADTSAFKSEYGSAADPEQFRVLFAYSPYHHVQDGGRYPAVLLLAGSGAGPDPYHSRKMIARLQAANAAKTPQLLRLDSGTRSAETNPLSEQIEEFTDLFSFLAQELGISWK